jgi:hypothetical protein
MHFDNTHHCSPPMILLRPVTKYLPPTSRSFNKKTCHWVQLVFPRCAQTQSKGHDPEGNGLPLSSHLLPLGPQTQSFASSSPIHSGILTDWVLCSSSVGNCTCCTLLSTKALSRRHCSVAVQCDLWVSQSFYHIFCSGPCLGRRGCDIVVHLRLCTLLLLSLCTLASCEPL